MSGFEYLRRVSIGQYLPLVSPIHRADPRAKLLAYSAMVAAISISGSVYGLVAALLLVMLLLSISHIPFSFAWRGWLAALPFIVILALLQIVITKSSTDAVQITKLLGMRLTNEGFLSAGRLLLRFTTLFFLLTVSTATLSTLETIHAIESLLKPLSLIKFPSTYLSMMVQVMMRFIPFLAINAEKIAKSQASRGAAWDGKRGGLIARAKRIFPLIIPLFIISLRQAETLTDAMLARGFDTRRVRTSLRVYVFTTMDGVFTLVMLVGALLVIWFPL